MPSPRRRRRFFALEGRFEVDDAGELQGVIDEARLEAAQAARASVAPSIQAGPAGADETLPPAFRLQRPSRTGVRMKDRFPVLPGLLLVAGLALGALAGYSWPREARKPPVAQVVGRVRPEAAALTPADEDQLDAAYAARHARHYAEAAQLFAALAQRHPGWGPMDIELGRTLLYENKSYDASFALKAAADRGVMPAEANFLLGMLNKARGEYAGAESDYADAVALDPTRPDYYFFWGESLRAEGKLLEAVAKFRSALLRNQNEAAIGLYRAKLWLSEIEADTEKNDGTRAEIDAALAQPHPPMEALVAAAARDLKAGDIDAAMGHLRRARRRAEPEVFAYILKDPFFASARATPELAELFGSASPEPAPPAGRAASSTLSGVPGRGLGQVPAVPATGSR